MERWVVVTGASSGIGEACTSALAEEGFRVFATVRRDADAERIARAHAAIVPVLLDVADESSVASARSSIEAKLAGAGLAGLVCNAGVLAVAPLEHQPAEELRRVLDVNFFGALSVTRALLPELRRARGRIVFMSSVNGRLSFPLLGAYSASKAALEAAADALRIELLPSGVHVSVIEPGAIATPMLRERTKGELVAPLGSSARDYEGLIDAVVTMMGQTRRGAASTGGVTRAVSAALSDARPRARYVVGSDAKLATFLSRALPDRARDALVTRVILRLRGKVGATEP